MKPYTSLVIFVIILLLLRRVTGMQISIVGSVLLTIVVSLIVRSLARDRDT